MFTLLTRYKMAGPEVVTPDSSQDKSSRFYVVSWFNRLLKTDFNDVREMGSGDSSLHYKNNLFHAP